MPAVTEPAYEEISFVFGYIRPCYEDGGIAHVDEWSQSQGSGSAADSEGPRRDREPAGGGDHDRRQTS